MAERARTMQHEFGSIDYDEIREQYNIKDEAIYKLKVMISDLI